MWELFVMRKSLPDYIIALLMSIIVRCPDAVKRKGEGGGVTVNVFSNNLYLVQFFHQPLGLGAREGGPQDWTLGLWTSCCHMLRKLCYCMLGGTTQP